MNKRERLLAASRRQAVDRIPIALWRHFPGDDQRAADLAQAGGKDAGKLDGALALVPGLVEQSLKK